MRNYAGSALMLLVTMAAALGCYTINLKVSAERSAVNQLRRQLVADARDMRNLQAEMRTRSRLPEMQRWNDNVLQMSAPAAAQFLRSPVQLASYGAEVAPPAVRYAVTNAEPNADAVAAPLTRAAFTPDATPPQAAPGVAAAAPSAPAPGGARIIRAAYAPVSRSAPVPSVLQGRARQPLNDLELDLDLAIGKPRAATTATRPHASAPAALPAAPLADGGQ